MNPTACDFGYTSHSIPLTVPADYSLSTVTTVAQNIPSFKGHRLSPEAINEYKQIVLEESGVELSNEQAYQDGIAFLDAFKLLAGDSLISNTSVETEKGKQLE